MRRAACRTRPRACWRNACRIASARSVVVENRAGGNGGVAAAVIAAAPADGYTLLVVDTTLLSVSPLFISQLTYNPQKDFVPIAALARTPLFLAVSADTPVKTLQEFIDYVKARPGPGQLRLGGRRQHASSHHGGGEVRAASRHHPRSLSGHQPGGAGAARRPRPGAVGLSQSSRRRRRRSHPASRQQRSRPLAAAARAAARGRHSFRGSIWSA